MAEIQAIIGATWVANAIEQIAQHVEWQFVERRIGTITRRHQAHRVTVGIGPHREFRADRAATAGVIVHDEILAE